MRLDGAGPTTAATTYRYNDASGALMEELDSSLSVRASYVTTPGGSPVSVTRGGHTYYYHTDAHGDVTSITDANGATVATFTYDAWGVPTELNAQGAPVSIGAWAGSPGDGLYFLFGGMLFDAATGLYLTRTRVYDPRTGRFLSRDQIMEKEKDGSFKGFPFGKDAIGTNLYVWCKNNPVTYVDPSGHHWEYSRVWQISGFWQWLWVKAGYMVHAHKYGIVGGIYMPMLVYGWMLYYTGRISLWTFLFDYLPNSGSIYLTFYGYSDHSYWVDTSYWEKHWVNTSHWVETSRWVPDPQFSQPTFRYMDAADVSDGDDVVWQRECGRLGGTADAYDNNGNIMRFYHYGIDEDEQKKSLTLAVFDYLNGDPQSLLTDLDEATLDVPRKKVVTNCPEPRM